MNFTVPINIFNAWYWNLIVNFTFNVKFTISWKFIKCYFYILLSVMKVGAKPKFRQWFRRPKITSNGTLNSRKWVIFSKAKNQIISIINFENQFYTLISFIGLWRKKIIPCSTFSITSIKNCWNYYNEVFVVFISTGVKPIKFIISEKLCPLKISESAT